MKQINVRLTDEAEAAIEKMQASQPFKASETAIINTAIVGYAKALGVVTDPNPGEEQETQNDRS